MREEVLYEIFVNLHKAYDALELWICLDIIAGYDMVNRSLRLLRRYWDCLVMVVRESGYHRETFKGYRRVTHGDPLPPTIFNVAFRAFLCHWVTEVVGE